MTHTEQIKWMSDRIARLEAQIESDMKNTATLMGRLDTKRPWVGLTRDEIEETWTAGACQDDPVHAVQSFLRAIEAKLKEKNK